MVSGVFLSLNGETIPNNSYVRFSDIGSDGSILCNTDRSDCCGRGDHPNEVLQGHWYNPEGYEVGSYATEYDINSNDFFARNRDTGVVRLFPTGIPTERGHFRCEIPNAAGVNIFLYVNIVDGE